MREDQKKPLEGLPAEAVHFIPHREPMLLIDTLNQSDSSSYVRGSATLRRDNIFLNAKGIFEPIGFVELIAQLAAAGEGYDARKNGSAVQKGYLVGISDFSFHANAQLGDTLELELQRTLQINNITVMEGAVYLKKKLLCKGSLKLYVENGELVNMERDLSPSREAMHDIDESLQKRHDCTQRNLVHQAVFKNLITIEADSKKGTCSALFCFKEDFVGFNGHFPEHPILPGVVMLNLPFVASELSAGLSLKPICLEHAKFMNFVVPGETLTVDISVRPTDDLHYKLSAKFKKSGALVAKMSFLTGTTDV